MEYSHKPVLLDECIEMLKLRPRGTYVDCTLGGAGHSGEIYKRLNEQGTLLAIDRDMEALRASKIKLEGAGGNARLLLVHGNFKELGSICRDNGITSADGILMDLGVSSHQLDEAERGFSYQRNAPLDMRMDKSSELTAEHVVNGYSEEALASVIREYGEERWAERIAAFICRSRERKTIGTTYELVEIIKAAIPAAARREGPHPAKRTFQAIRIEVNGELKILKNAVDSSVSLLKSGGRLCIITFHSLEDRIVKNAFRQHEDPCTCPADFPVCVCGRKPTGKTLASKPIVPSERERELNPRSRSAKLRVLERL